MIEYFTCVGSHRTWIQTRNWKMLRRICEGMARPTTFVVRAEDLHQSIGCI